MRGGGHFEHTNWFFANSEVGPFFDIPFHVSLSYPFWKWQPKVVSGQFMRSGQVTLPPKKKNDCACIPFLAGIRLTCYWGANPPHSWLQPPNRAKTLSRGGGLARWHHLQNDSIFVVKKVNKINDLIGYDFYEPKVFFTWQNRTTLYIQFSSSILVGGALRSVTITTVVCWFPAWKQAIKAASAVIVCCTCGGVVWLVEFGRRRVTKGWWPSGIFSVRRRISLHLARGIKHVTDLSSASLVSSFRSRAVSDRNVKHAFLQM